jgi:hypothetical protein
MGLGSPDSPRCRRWFVAVEELVGLAEEFFGFAVVFRSGH